MAKITRRRFFTALGTAVAAAGGYAYGIEPHLVKIVCHDLPVAGLPTDLDGKRLVQISDLHVGPTGDSYLIDCLTRVGKLRPELIVITGDFMTACGTERLESVAAVLGHLPKPPLGVYGSLGNHDYGQTWRDTRIADALVPVLTDVGVRMLRNERVDVAGLQLVGLDELWARQFRPEEALAGFDYQRPGLVLSHNPDTVDRSGWGAYQGWILSGHTHGGQCRFPLLGAPFLPVENLRYVSGEFDLGDGRRLYVNRGLGFNRRVRFNARPEITAFTLRRVDRLG